MKTSHSRGWRTLSAFALVASGMAVSAVSPGVATAATPTDLFFSEYIEGSSNNKALEIYNGTGAAVDLVAGGYTLERYANGAVTFALIPLTGSIADGDVYVVANTQANAAILAIADSTSGNVSWNGDDGIVLRKNGVAIDSFGQIGVDPGTEWTGGGLDDTLRRMETVCAGDTNPDDAFDASIEWNTFPVDTIDGLGSHTTNCGGGSGAALIADCGATLFTAAGAAASAAVTASDADDTVVAMTLVGDDVSPGGNLTAGTFTASAAVGDPATLELNLDALADIGSYTATIEAQNSSGDTTTCDLQIEVVGVTAIHDVQGPGSVSPVVGTTVVIEGIVVGDFQDGVAGTNGDLNGFHVQEENADADTDPLTSEGIFVFNGSNPTVDVAIGDLVRVRGEVSEFKSPATDARSLTEITSFSDISILSSGNALPTAATVSLPVSSIDDFEKYEGMSVTFPQALVISEYFNFDRFNEIVLSSERHLTPTAEFEPGPAAVQAAADFLLDKITLDDGRTNQNPDPAIHPNGGVFDLDNLFRGGDTVANVTGVLDYGFGLYRVQPTQGADYTSVNPRTAAPDPVGGNVTVSSFNVLNYFTTIDDGVNDICGALQNQECRGADDAGELTRQRDKIVSALAAIDADVFGLIEIENNVDDDAVIDLVDSLNAVAGAGTYDLISTGTIGTDAIKVAMIYKPAAVTPAGAYAILDGSVDARFLDSKNRPVLAQTFTHNATGSAFTVAVNHLKSKGSDCLDVGDPDTGDGAGNCNITRTQAAEALVDWLATDPTGSGDPDFLIIGDLNSYDKEDPIDAIIAAGYDDLVAEFLGEDAYSYVFDGQTGYLDHGLASSSLSERVSGVTVWHINADEADLIDYDTSFKGPNQDAIFAPDAYRSSDHDPVIIGLELESARSLKRDVAADLVSLLPTNDWRDAWRIVVAAWRVEQSLHHSYWIDDTTLDARRGLLVFVRERQAVIELDRVSGVDVQFAIDALIDADRRLASRQLQAAIDASGSQHNIERAQAYLAAAEAEVADGDFDKAIAEFGKAWYQAVRAIG